MSPACSRHILNLRCNYKFLNCVKMAKRVEAANKKRRVQRTRKFPFVDTFNYGIFVRLFNSELWLFTRCICVCEAILKLITLTCTAQCTRRRRLRFVHAIKSYAPNKCHLRCELKSANFVWVWVSSRLFQVVHINYGKSSWTVCDLFGKKRFRVFAICLISTKIAARRFRSASVY